MGNRVSNPDIPPFHPPFFMRHGLAQTVLASSKFRKSGAHPMETTAQARILDVGGDIKLKASVSKHPEAKALIIFLHGWEGSENSTYVISCGRQLYDKGCSVARLNFRDHGDTHHLNQGIFHSARTDEVLEGVRQCAAFAGGLPVYLIGFSLGGNFALRVVRDAQKQGGLELAHVFAISPAIDPDNASPMVDENPFVKRYFYKKWSTSLRKKQAAFPDDYNFDDLFKIDTVMGITEQFLPAYTEYQSVSEYFNAYKIDDDDLADCQTPTTLIMAADDPVLPAADMLKLRLSPAVRSIMLRRGGHNGFFQSLRGPTWYDDYIQSIIFAEA